MTACIHTCAGSSGCARKKRRVLRGEAAPQQAATGTFVPRVHVCICMRMRIRMMRICIRHPCVVAFARSSPRCASASANGAATLHAAAAPARKPSSLFFFFFHASAIRRPSLKGPAVPLFAVLLLLLLFPSCCLCADALSRMRRQRLWLPLLLPLLLRLRLRAVLLLRLFRVVFAIVQVVVGVAVVVATAAASQRRGTRMRMRICSAQRCRAL